MDKVVYVSANGADQLMLRQAINTHNLANVNTTGFRADLAQFVTHEVHGDGFATRIFAGIDDYKADFTHGKTISTGKELDIAIKEEGWIAVQSASGKEAYTRAGDLHISPEGMLVTSRGDYVLGNGGPIAIPPAEKIEIGLDGTISIRPTGQGSEGLAQLDRIKLVNPSNQALLKGEDGLFYHKEKLNLQPDPSVQVVSGAIESSNVNAVEMLVNLMDTQRLYEVQVKMMQLAEQNDESSEKIMDV